VVQQGRFTMGAPAGEEARENLPNELRGSSVPQHLIKIRHKLAIAKFDVTRDEYASLWRRQIGRTPIAALRLMRPEPASLLQTAIGILQGFRRPEETPSSV